ncbi:histidine kinase [Microlunatus sp. GCM10028923]|uniref:sensor histidine kinase n=1 Tax=Microlunatus sp. GCM10028923 TaxID=3273400 RepID=UPI00362450B9
MITTAAARKWPLVLPGLALLLIVITVVACVVVGADWQDVVDGYVLTNLVVGLGYVISGAVVQSYRPGNVVGPLMTLGGFGHLSTAVIGSLWQVGAAADWPTWLLRTMIGLSGGWTLGLGGMLPALVLLFPDGRLPSPRWRPVLWLTIAVTAYQIIDTALSPYENRAGDQRSASILALPAPLPEAMFLIANLVGGTCMLLAIISLVLRYRRSGETGRRQLLWLLLAVIAMGVINAQRWITGDGPILLLLTFVLIPTAMAIAVVRHGLWDIREIVSRALVYGVLICLVVACYVGLVAGLSRLMPVDAGHPLAIAGVLVITFALNPVRLLLQRAVARAVYGHRTEPAAAAQQLGERLADSDDLDAVLDQIRNTLRLPALAVRDEEVPVAAAGTPPPGAAQVDVPLARSGGRHWTLEVTLRAGERRLHEADRRVIAVVSGPLGLLLRAQALAAQLQDARAAVIEARERERALLYRDLHDGMGPKLTSAAFRVDAAANLVGSRPDDAQRLLREARAAVGEAVTEVRRVVYGLRPLALDQLGLVGAVREHARQFGDQVVVTAPDRIDQASPAVELAAYRITLEAIANAQRHSSATRIDVTIISGPPGLTVSITDNGAPDRAWVEGVGVRSMRERSEELGGGTVVGPAGDGWSVVATLPLHT